MSIEEKWKDLTEAQRATLVFCCLHFGLNDRLPTTREIQRHFGYSSQTYPAECLKELVRKGILEQPKGNGYPYRFAKGDRRTSIKVTECPLASQIVARVRDNCPDLVSICYREDGAKSSSFPSGNPEQGLGINEARYPSNRRV